MKNSLPFLFVRAFAYMLFVAGLVYLVTLEGYRMGAASEYSEYSTTEFLESGLAILGALILLLVARIQADLKPVSAMLAALFCMMFIREADFFLDEQVFDGAWQLLVLAVLVFITFYLWKQNGSISESIKAFARQPSAGIFLSGFLALFVFSRLFGRESFWQAVMGEGYMRVVKNIAEEGTEVLGYGLLTIAAMELLVASLLSDRDSQRH
jgi:hypothetical protein